MLSSHMWLVAPLLQSMIVFVCYAESEVRDYKTRINWHPAFVFSSPQDIFHSQQFSTFFATLLLLSVVRKLAVYVLYKGSQARLPGIKSHVHLFLDMWLNRDMSYNLLTSLPLSYEAAQFFWSSIGFSALLIFFQNKWMDTCKMFLLRELLANDVF